MMMIHVRACVPYSHVTNPENSGLLKHINAITISIMYMYTQCMLLTVSINMCHLISVEI